MNEKKNHIVITDKFGKQTDIPVGDFATLTIHVQNGTIISAERSEKLKFK
jgi:hypothetical protein